MSFIQLVQPNLNTAGRIGYCLEYARKCFGAPAVEPNAWTAWNNTQVKHLDSDLPSDVSVPMWYSYVENGQNLGHVTINVPGQGIYSSPWKQGTDHAVLPSIAEVERIYGVKYVGWSEDISGVQVIKEGVSMPNAQEANDFWKKYIGVDLTKDQVAYYTAQPWNVLSDDVLVTMQRNDQEKIADLTKKLEIAQASNPNSDATKWETLKVLVKSLIS